MNQHIIDWNLERAADELTWVNRAQVQLSADPQQFAYEITEWRYEVGMNIASANALIETRTQIGLLDNFAGMAMQTLLGKLNEYPDENLPVGVAWDAYRIADAMLIVRSVRLAEQQGEAA